MVGVVAVVVVVVVVAIAELLAVRAPYSSRLSTGSTLGIPRAQS